MFMIDAGAPSYYSTLGLTPTASFDEIRAKGDQIGEELQRKLADATTTEKKQQVEAHLTEINNVVNILKSPEKRAAYDNANAHLVFFTLQVAAAPLFVEKSDQLYVE